MRYAGLDSRQSVFFEEQLVHIKGKILEKLRPELKLLQLIPISMNTPAGAATIRQRQYDLIGMAQIVSNMGDDLPKVDVVTDEDDVPVRTLGDFFEESLEEIEAASMAGFPLSEKRALAALRAIQRKLNSLALIGDSKHGLYGILTHPNIPKAALPNGGWTFASDPDDILEDIHEIVSTPFETTGGVENTNLVIFPSSVWSILLRKKVGNLDNTTIMKHLKESYPDVKFDYVADFNAVTNPRTGSGTTSVAVGMRQDPDVLSLEVPLPYDQRPPQPHNLGFKIPCRAKSAGILTSRPYSAGVFDGVAG